MFRCHIFLSCYNCGHIAPAIDHCTRCYKGSNFYQMIAETIIAASPVLQLSSNNARMNLQRIGEAENVPLCKKWVLSSNETLHGLIWHTKVLCGFVRDAFFFWNIWPSSRILTFKIYIEHVAASLSTVTMQNVLNLVA